MITLWIGLHIIIMVVLLWMGTTFSIAGYLLWKDEQERKR